MRAVGNHARKIAPLGYLQTPAFGSGRVPERALQVVPPLDEEQVGVPPVAVEQNDAQLVLPEASWTQVLPGWQSLAAVQVSPGFLLPAVIQMAPLTIE
jgi:hypothetical protein